MKLSELLEAWEFGAKISYSYNGNSYFIGEYDAEKIEGFKTLFYRHGVKFRVHK
jgi:hypothetical protein